MTKQNVIKRIYFIWLSPFTLVVFYSSFISISPLLGAVHLLCHARIAISNPPSVTKFVLRIKIFSMKPSKSSTPLLPALCNKWTIPYLIFFFVNKFNSFLYTYIFITTKNIQKMVNCIVYCGFLPSGTFFPTCFTFYFVSSFSLLYSACLKIISFLSNKFIFHFFFSFLILKRMKWMKLVYLFSCMHKKSFIAHKAMVQRSTRIQAEKK